MRFATVANKALGTKLIKKRVQLPHNWFETPTWPPLYCIETPTERDVMCKHTIVEVAVMGREGGVQYDTRFFGSTTIFFLLSIGYFCSLDALRWKLPICRVGR